MAPSSGGAEDGGAEARAMPRWRARQIDREVVELWLAFLGSMAFLVTFAALCLVSTKGGAPSVSTAVRHCFFWLFAAFLFFTFTWYYLGNAEAQSWLIGYALEYMLSFDNLFIFHLVFTSYRAPQAQIHRGVFFAMCWGICARFILFFLGSGLFNSTKIFRWIFGGVLIYSGVKVILVDEEGADPTENAMVAIISRYIPLHPDYAPGARFFVRVDGKGLMDREGDSPTVLGRSEAEADEPAREVQLHTDLRGFAAVPRAHVEVDALDSLESEMPSGPMRWKATPLLLALMTLLVIDAVFAVDSVTAKVSMVSQYDDRIDLYLNFTSTAYAMLCMPNLFFVIQLLVPMFRFLKYGIGSVLALIGVKLWVGEHYPVREDVSCLIMLSVLGVSVMLSLLLPSGNAERPLQTVDSFKPGVPAIPPGDVMLAQL